LSFRWPRHGRRPLPTAHSWPTVTTRWPRKDAPALLSSRRHVRCMNSTGLPGKACLVFHRFCSNRPADSAGRVGGAGCSRMGRFPSAGLKLRDPHSRPGPGQCRPGECHNRDPGFLPPELLELFVDAFHVDGAFGGPVVELEAAFKGPDINSIFDNHDVGAGPSPRQLFASPLRFLPAIEVVLFRHAVANHPGRVSPGTSPGTSGVGRSPRDPLGTRLSG